MQYNEQAPDTSLSNVLDNQEFEDIDKEESYFLEDEDIPESTQSGQAGFGTNAIITAINEMAKKNNPQPYDIFLINIDTLIRNVTTKDKSEDEIKNDTSRDLGNLLDAISLYMRTIENLLDMPYILVYFPEYETPQVKLHERTYKNDSVKAIIKNIHNDFVKEDNLKERKQIRSSYNNIDVYELYTGDRSELPYKVLTRFVNGQSKFNPGGIRNVLKNMMMISHCPLDYYFLLNFPRTHLLESFTGKLIKKEQLGVKVFKDGFVPFNRVTHLLFGDSVQLMPMAKGRRGKNNNRKLLMDMARRQNWNFRTPDEIAEYVGASGQVPKSILMNIRF